MTKLNAVAERLRRPHEVPCDINLLQPIMLQEYRTTGYSPTAIRNLELISEDSAPMPDKYYTSAQLRLSSSHQWASRLTATVERSGTALYLSVVKSDL